MLDALPDAILSLVFPQRCNVCNGEVTSIRDGLVCSECWLKTKIFDGTETLCIKCGAFLSGSSSINNSARCRRCEDQDFDHAYAIGIYELGLKVSVLSLKKTPHLPRRLQRLIAATLRRTSLDRTTVIPIPLSARRLHERGFNQASVLARHVTKHLATSADEVSLIRRTHTPMHRAGMDKKARERTVESVFEVIRPKLIEGRDILLVDDVMTSGATAAACAKILKKNGARKVHVFTLARAD